MKIFGLRPSLSDVPTTLREYRLLRLKSAAGRNVRGHNMRAQVLAKPCSEEDTMVRRRERRRVTAVGAVLGMLSMLSLDPPPSDT